MPTYDNETAEMITHAKRGEKPYSLVCTSGLTMLSFVRDHLYNIDSKIGEAGHACWRGINESTTRNRKVKFNAMINQGKVVLIKNNEEREVLPVEITLPRSRESNEYYSVHDVSVKFNALDEGDEYIITKCHFCPDSMESGFVARHPEKKNAFYPDNEMTHGDNKDSSPKTENKDSIFPFTQEGGVQLANVAAHEFRTENFRKWAGSLDVATVAIVFTDILNSTKLNVEEGDEYWRQVREAHFRRATNLIKKHHGYLIKTIGDSVMTTFHNSADALDFALNLQRQTGHKLVEIRAGIHIGPVEIKDGDAFGQQVSMAARVEAKAKDGGVWVSTQVKEDIDVFKASKHRNLKWVEHADEELKGFPGKYKLWSVE